MPKLRPIQWKALLLLVTFTSSFTVFCHCASGAAGMSTAVAMSGHRRSCCDNLPAKPERRPKRNDGQQQNNCQGMQAVQFHLLEKQAANHIDAAPAPMTAIVLWNVEQPLRLIPAYTEQGKLPQQWSYKHSPPSLLSLYQCFLI